MTFVPTLNRDMMREHWVEQNHPDIWQEWEDGGAWQWIDFKEWLQQEYWELLVEFDSTIK